MFKKKLELQSFQFIFLILLLIPSLTKAAEIITWTDAKQLTIEGKGWENTELFYDRLPAKAKKVVSDPIWRLSRNSSGYVVYFSTNSRKIYVKWSLLSPSLSSIHMPATGVSGVDLYAKNTDNYWKYVGTGHPKKQSDNEEVFRNPGSKEFALYLPLYNGVTSLSIGVTLGNSLTPTMPMSEKPIVFYGTSITQGGCASRPGMAYTAIVGRKLNVPIINLGFSGNGRMEPVLADLLSELDPAVYVLDTLWNMSPELIEERLAPFVRKLRAAHPETPIVLAEDSTIRTVPTIKGAILRRIFSDLQKEGINNIIFVSADGMMGPDDEGTVDGVHPTDLGFMYQSQVFINALKDILNK